MRRSVLSDAFGHHVWATLRVFDVCQTLTDEQLAATARGTYGSILDTMRHLVGADASYLFALTGGRHAPIDEDQMDLAELRAAMETYGAAWDGVLAEDGDPDEMVVRHRDDGSQSFAPRGIRLAQALHHGTDHRSQVCTILSTLGVEPPAIDVWDFAEPDGRLSETQPTA